MTENTSRPLLGWVIGGLDCFDRLARNPKDIPAEHTFVFGCEEERVDMEASLFIHKYHPAAFKKFPDFDTDMADHLYGTPQDEFGLMDQHTCPGISPMSADTWPWIFGHPKPVFDIVVAPMMIIPENQDDSAGGMQMVAVVSARGPMIHLALLWGLHEHHINVRIIRNADNTASVYIQQGDGEDVLIAENVDAPEDSIASVRHSWLIALPTCMDEWYEADIRAHSDCDWSKYLVFEALLCD